MKYKCGRCKQVRHNRARCTELIAYDNDAGTSGGGRNQAHIVNELNYFFDNYNGVLIFLIYYNV